MINKVLLMEFFKDDDIKVVDKDFYIKSQMKNDVIKYITTLEEEIERLNKKYDKALELLQDFNMPCECVDCKIPDEYCEENCSVDCECYKKCWNKYIELELKEGK